MTLTRTQPTSARFAGGDRALSSSPSQAAAAVFGFQRAGMLDWPGRLAATVFLGGCNLRCPYCHNPQLVSAGCSGQESARLFDHLSERREWLDGVVITGGEPTAAEGLRELIVQVKEVGLPVKLDTNGTAPAVVETLIDQGLIDFIAVDIKATPERYVRATGRSDVWAAVQRTIAIVLGCGVDHEFRTTCYPPAVGPDDLVHIAARICGARRYVLQQFRPVKTLDAAALSVRPHGAETLRRTAERCSLFVPTVVRGV